MEISNVDRVFIRPEEFVKTSTGKVLTPGEIAAMEVVDVMPRFRKGPYAGPSVLRAIWVSCGLGALAAAGWSVYELGRIRKINDWYQEYDRLRREGFYDECGGMKQV